jgi:cytidylate kinase
VLPDADLKIYLDASATERARRRFQEMQSRGAPAEMHEVLSAVLERDRIDSTRDIAPLRVAPDAVLIDSETISADEVLRRVRELCEGG